MASNGNGRRRGCGVCHGSLVTNAFLSWAVHLTVIRVTHTDTTPNAMALWGKVQAQCWQQISKFKTCFDDSALRETSLTSDSIKK